MDNPSTAPPHTSAMENVIPANEAERLAAVRRYDILDTPPDGAFDRVAALAAKLFDVPISIVSIVDHDRIWFQSHHGVGVSEIGRDPGLCASAILRDEPHILPDAKLDPRALANPLVAGEFGLRFYAGVPLRTRDGFNLGTLCVIDKKPREVAPHEIAMLQDLAAIVMEQLELRLSARVAAFRTESMAKEIAESGQEFRFLADSMTQKMFRATATGDVDYFNPVWSEFTGLSFEQIKDWGWTQFIHPDDLEENVRTRKQSLETGQAFQFEHRFRRADGEYRWHLSQATPLRDSSGNVYKWIGSNTDIHDQKMREDVARAAASRAKFMAQEVDHRVMNSLQYVSALLTMQGDLAGDQQVADELKIAASRVSAIARVHRHFYEDQSADTVACLAFLKRLGADLSFILRTKIDVEGTDAIVPTRSIVPIGLLLNELVTNAVKHGAGSIGVSLRPAADGRSALCVTDEGAGLPDDFHPESSNNGLGMKVIVGLTNQLNGKLLAGSNPSGRGASFTVTFPTSPPL